MVSYRESLHRKYDSYAGAGIGDPAYSIKWNTGYENWTGYEAGSSGLMIEALAGARYAFSPKMAASLRIVGSPIGWGSGIGTTVGLTFNMK